jgi:hypothetical protein
MDTRVSGTGRCDSPAPPRVHAAWLLLLAIPFWGTVWVANAALISVRTGSRCAIGPTEVRPLRDRDCNPRLGDFPVRRHHGPRNLGDNYELIPPTYQTHSHWIRAFPGGQNSFMME